jgi:hypothetical protein
MPQRFASNGSSGFVQPANDPEGRVHLDTIQVARLPRTYSQTTVNLESGAPISQHRERPAWPLALEVTISDVEPVVGATLVGLWEQDHARRTQERLEALQDAGTSLQVFDGERFRRTPAGRDVWILASIEDVGEVDDLGVYRARLGFQELPRFSTPFTSAASDVDPEFQDSVDGLVDKGQQSTETVPADVASTVSLAG